MRTPRLHNNAAPFIAFLQRYQNDRGALANLRGALSDARKPNAWPLLAGFPVAIGNSAYEIVAALWACDPDLDCTSGCLSDTLAKLNGEHHSFEGRFKRLLTCDHDEIAERVAPVIRTAQTKGLRINYTQLLSDLLWWGDEVKVRWAKAFWGVAEPDDTLNPDLLDAKDPAAVAMTEVQA
ncbi:MAG: type I-E CRISPR-associated protein Cse2/CasB [Kiritimatiellaeota bacterium]|nr:type I-E CRISPR-associated protein Cse2/CasB [Kiritimatiellota bacterium]